MNLFKREMTQQRNQDLIHFLYCWPIFVALVFPPWGHKTSYYPNCFSSVTLQSFVWVLNFSLTLRQCMFVVLLVFLSDGTQMTSSWHSPLKCRCAWTTSFSRLSPSSVEVESRGTMQQACEEKITTGSQLHTVRPPCSLLHSNTVLRMFLWTKPKALS